MKEIPLIEGFRGYLALWVVIDHLLGCCGYGLNSLTGFFYVLRSGWYAVDLFIIISGFVVFYLLDNKKENYRQFIVRRFFRLWPLFIFLFLISIPLSKLQVWNVNQFSVLFKNKIIGDGMIIEQINSWWDNIWIHILIHIPMLHGIIPNEIVRDAPGAFLGPAWSISLEWQFYLIAPLLFITIKKFKIIGFFLVFLFCVFFFYWGLNIENIQFGAFLPMHMDFFFLGIISYLLYKYLIEIKKYTPFSLICVFPVTLFLYSILNFKIEYLPYFIWINFFSLLIDFNNNDNKISKIISYAFHNKLFRFLGKISYSIYLSHFLVIIIMQFLFLCFLPSFSQREHFFLLSFSTLCVTIGFSVLLYNFIELYFIKKGSEIVKKLN